MSDLSALLALQHLDTAADQLRHRRATLPERTLLAGIDAELSRLRAELGEAATEKDRLGAEQERLEAEVAQSEDKRRGLERRLSSTSVPREAQAMSDEIDGLQARQRGLEDQLLEIMETLEPLEARLAAGTAEEVTLAARRSVAAAALAGAEAGMDSELAAVGAARTDAVGSIPDALLARYERLRAKMGGVAVATLDGARCTGCSLTLPTSELERVRSASSDSIVECEQCGRILVRS